MKWYHYLLTFLAGFFLTNTLPHLVQGISGKNFPTLFSELSGKDFSPP